MNPKADPGRELSDPSGDAAGAKLRKAFRDAESAVKAKMEKEFGAEFISRLVNEFRHEVDRLPMNIEQKIRDLLQNKLEQEVKAKVEAGVRQMWGDFIKKEIQKAVDSPDMVLTMAKKLKEIL